jgi:hypothetical protein
MTSGQVPVILAMLPYGASINSIDGRARSALTIAIERRKTDILEGLLKLGGMRRLWMMMGGFCCIGLRRREMIKLVDCYLKMGGRQMYQIRRRRRRWQSRSF